MASRQRCAVATGSGRSHPMQNQQQRTQNTATPRRGESDEARPDQKTEEGCSGSLGRWPAIVVQHLPTTCTGFLREMLWSLGSFVTERERPSIFQPFYSSSNVDDGVPEPEQKPVLCECDVGVIQQPAQSAQLMQFDVEQDEENGTEELHAGTVVTLHTTMADGSGDEQRDLALIERWRANSEPEANYGLVKKTYVTVAVTLMHWVRVDIGAWRRASG
ncbi:uncharacterized protein LOC125943275 [Dermacentor silvarum]|uniref:uncharacterized protein LOC125943275 n=1 Tax=Dermacentor silvarum TaxID=543639 RepID=UPI0021007C4E|nr:uncharacterized protein LOC125943275 [Dermacentor silvarum]